MPRCTRHSALRDGYGVTATITGELHAEAHLVHHGVSSGFGRRLTDQLLERGDCIVGTVRDTGKVTDLIERYPEALHAEVLDVTDTAAIREVIERSLGSDAST